MKPTLYLRLPSVELNCLIAYGGNSVLPVAFTTTFADRYWKSAPGNVFVVPPPASAYGAAVTAVGRMAAAVLHAEELGGALVELVVPDRREVDVHQVRCDHGRLVVEERTRERARADVVACEDRRLVRAVLCLQILDLLGQERGSAGELAVLRLAHRIERPVQVVEGEQMHLAWPCGPVAAGRS